MQLHIVTYIQSTFSYKRFHIVSAVLLLGVLRLAALLLFEVWWHKRYVTFLLHFAFTIAAQLLKHLHFTTTLYAACGNPRVFKSATLRHYRSRLSLRTRSTHQQCHHFRFVYRCSMCLHVFHCSIGFTLSLVEIIAGGLIMPPIIHTFNVSSQITHFINFVYFILCFFADELLFSVFIIHSLSLFHVSPGL